MTLNPFKWARAFITYQHSDVFGDFAGPDGYEPPTMVTPTQIMSTQQQAIDESLKEDPEAKI